MPQDGLKSTVYRSFITCSDPKGVVDCGIMMRRSKSSGGKEMMEKQKKIEIQKQSKNSIRPSSSLELLISQDQEFPSSSSSSSFQLKEVSRGAQRLNHMIDSWSNEKKGFDDGIHGKSNKHIGTDLLRGALDLQESLVMLGKLQEASQYMSSLNKKNMRNVQRAYPDRYRDQEFVKPRLSSDGYSSRTSNEELKKVIRDSLVRQNLFDDSSNPEKGCAYSPQRYREYSCSESTPSTSSSQSSMFQTSSEFSSISSQKAKGPGLIAKLMGIEEYPLKPLQENERISHQQRPAFEIDRPQLRKTQTSAPSGDSDLRTLKEVLETLKFKGLLRNKSFEEPKFEFQHATHSESGNRFVSGSSPIVLIKPIAVESPEVESHVPVVRGDEAFCNRRMINKLRSLEELTLTRVRTTEGALECDKVQRKIEAEESPPIKKPIKAERPKSHKGSVEKRGEKEAKTKESAPRKLKASQNVVHKPQKEAIDKRVDKIQKVAAVSKKSPEKDVMKAKHALKSQDQANMTSTKARKPESGSNITKTLVARQPSTVANTTPKHSKIKNVVSNSTERRRSLLRKEKPVKEPKSVIKNVVNEEHVRRVDISEKSESSLMSSNTDDQLLNDQEIEGHYNIFQSSNWEAVPLSSGEVINTETAEEAPAYISQSRNNGKIFRNGENLGAFLLSNALFLSHAEEFFDVDVNDSRALQTSSISSSGLCSTRLVLDCAGELVECKRFQVSPRVNPLSLVFRDRQRVCILLEKLVKDVCNGIKTLGSYSKLAGENILADSLYAMLERDVMCKGVGKGTWDLGWRHGFSGDEAEQVVNDIERLIFIGLIKEVFA